MHFAEGQILRKFIYVSTCALEGAPAPVYKYSHNISALNTANVLRETMQNVYWNVLRREGQIIYKVKKLCFLFRAKDERHLIMFLVKKGQNYSQGHFFVTSVHRNE